MQQPTLSCGECPAQALNCLSLCRQILVCFNSALWTMLPATGKTHSAYLLKNFQLSMYHLFKTCIAHRLWLIHALYAGRIGFLL